MERFIKVTYRNDKDEVVEGLVPFREFYDHRVSYKDNAQWAIEQILADGTLWVTEYYCVPIHRVLSFSLVKECEIPNKPKKEEEKESSSEVIEDVKSDEAAEDPVSSVLREAKKADAMIAIEKEQDLSVFQEASNNATKDLDKEIIGKIIEESKNEHVEPMVGGKVEITKPSSSESISQKHGSGRRLPRFKK